MNQNLKDINWKDGRNIAIGGPSGCGKSTLASGLSLHFGFNRYPIDSLVRTLGRVFPHLEISHHNANTESQSFQAFIAELFEALPHNSEGSKFVVDSCYFTPKSLFSLDSKEWNTIFVGCPSLNIDDFINRIKFGHRDNWMRYDLSLNELYNWLSKSIEQSRVLQEQCLELGKLFLDNSEANYHAILSQLRCHAIEELWNE